MAATVGTAVSAVAFAPFAILAPRGLWESVWGQASRPLEIESLAAAYLKVRDDPSIVSNYGALAIEHHRALAAATTAAGVLVLVALCIGFARGAATPERFARFAAACVGADLSPHPFSWSQPHYVNEHVAGVAAELRAHGHDLTVVAPRRAPKSCSPAAASCTAMRRRARLHPGAFGRPSEVVRCGLPDIRRAVADGASPTAIVAEPSSGNTAAPRRPR